MKTDISCCFFIPSSLVWLMITAHPILYHFSFLPPFPLKWSQVLVSQSCLTLCDPRHYSPQGSSVHGILQARILEWAAISFSRGSFQSRDQTRVSHTAGRFFTVWATREVNLFHCLSFIYLSTYLCIRSFPSTCFHFLEFMEDQTKDHLVVVCIHSVAWEVGAEKPVLSGGLSTLLLSWE